jgi:hypothetical protein
MDIGNDQANKTLVAASVMGLIRATRNTRVDPTPNLRGDRSNGFPLGLARILVQA